MITPDYATMKILVVDDMFNMRQTLKNMLRHIGFTKITDADNGEKALEVIESKPIDFIICDWNMPKMAGLEFLRQMRSNPQHRDTPFLMITAEVNESRIVQAAETEVDGYLIKPFIAKSLEKKIGKILENKARPSEFETNMKAGVRFLDEGKHDEAISDFAQALKLKPESARARLFLGEGYKAKGDMGNAERWLKGAVRSNPQYIHAYESLGDLYAGMGKEEEASQALEKASEISPDNAERQVKLGKLYIKTGQEEKADIAFQAALKSDTSQAELHTEIGEIYLAAGKDAKAAEAFQSSLSKVQSVHVYNRLGIALRKEGRLSEAIIEYHKALLIVPNDEALYYNIGRAYLDNNQKEKAIESLKHALVIDPDFKECTELIAHIKATK